MLQGNLLAAALILDPFHFLFSGPAINLELNIIKIISMSLKEPDTAHTHTVLPELAAMQSPHSQHIQQSHSVGTHQVRSAAPTQPSTHLALVVVLPGWEAHSLTPSSLYL